MKIACIGSGAFSLAMASLLGRKSENELSIWTHSIEWKEKEEKKVKKENPSIKNIETDFLKCVTDADVVFLLVSSPFMKDMIDNFKKIDFKKKTILIGSKGLLDEKPYYFSEYIKKNLKGCHFGFFMGPNLAEDIKKTPYSSFSVAYNHKDVKKILECILPETILIHYSRNFKILEFASVMKNIYAIGSGIIFEATISKSARETYLSLAFKELYCYLDNYFFYSNEQIFLDIMGDFFLTGSMEESRNFSFGRETFKNKKEDFLKSHTVEGFNNFKIVMKMLKNIEEELPILYLLSDIILNNEDAKKLLNIF